MLKSKTFKRALLLLTTAILPLSATAVAASCGSSDPSNPIDEDALSPEFRPTSLDVEAADKTSNLIYDTTGVPLPVRLEEKAAQDALINAATLPVEQQAQADPLILFLSKELNKNWSEIGADKTTYPTLESAINAGLKPRDFVTSASSYAPDNNQAVISAFLYAAGTAWGIDANKMAAVKSNVATIFNNLTFWLSDSVNPSFIKRITNMLEDWDQKGANALSSWSEFIYAWQFLATDTPASNYSYTPLRAALVGNGEPTRTASNSISLGQLRDIDKSYFSNNYLFDFTPETNIIILNVKGDPIPGGTTIFSEAPKVAGSRIVKITNEKDAKTYILKSKNKAAEIILSAIKEEMAASTKTETIEVFFKAGKPKDLGIDPTAVSTGTEISKLAANVFAKLINSVWITRSTIKLEGTNLITELQRLMAVGIEPTEIASFNQNLKTFYQNFEGKDGAADQTGEIDYSWANLLHFVRIFLDDTKLGNFEREALYAMLLNFGKTRFETFNNNIAQPYTSAEDKPTGGYLGYNLTPYFKVVRKR